MARGLHGFERPPWWAVVLMALGVAAVAVFLPLGLARGRLSPHQIAQYQAEASADASSAAASASAAAKPQPIKPGPDGKVTALIVGDSYSVGAGSKDPQTKGVVPLLASRFGWTTDVVSVSGGGYVQVGTDRNGPYSNALTAIDPKTVHPNVVLVEGGLNDVKDPPSRIHAAAGALFGKIRAAWPGVPVVVVGVLWPGSPRPPNVIATTEAVATAASLYDNLLYVDASGWTYPTISDGKHPTDVGHRAIADGIAQALQQAGMVGQ